MKDILTYEETPTGQVRADRREFKNGVTFCIVTVLYVLQVEVRRAVFKSRAASSHERSFQNSTTFWRDATEQDINILNLGPKPILAQQFARV
jgi:hypothetical protein